MDDENALIMKLQSRCMDVDNALKELEEELEFLRGNTEHEFPIHRAGHLYRTGFKSGAIYGAERIANVLHKHKLIGPKSENI